MSWLRRWWRKIRVALGGGRILCDTCKFDYGDACTRPERPNAVICDDYEAM
jgi:hypothetical protein